MSRSLPIRAVAMYQRDIVVNRHPIPAATVFPFFDIDGTIFYLLIVDSVSGQLSVCEPSDVVRIPWYRAIEFRRSSPISHADYVAELADLLHFDPWWMLAETPFTDFDYVPILKATNCVGDFDKDVTGLYFSGKLKKVTSSYIQTSEAYSTKKFIKHKAALKYRHGERKTPRPVSPHPSGGWRLDPFWQTETKTAQSSWGSDS